MGELVTRFSPKGEPYRAYTYDRHARMTGSTVVSHGGLADGNDLQEELRTYDRRHRLVRSSTDMMWDRSETSVRYGRVETSIKRHYDPPEAMHDSTYISVTKVDRHRDDLGRVVREEVHIGEQLGWTIWSTEYHSDRVYTYTYGRCESD